MIYERTLRVNGKEVTLAIPANRTLLDILREDLALTGAKRACESGRCGACTVLLNGDPVYACRVLGVELEGAEVFTVEGLEKGEELNALQQAFAYHNAMQCGYCTSGMLMSSFALLQRLSRPDEAEIRNALLGNYCRCTGYADIIKAVQVASRARK